MTWEFGRISCRHFAFSILTFSIFMLKRTSLYAAHQKLGGKLIEFGGWEMPVQYTSITDEHLAVRNAAGIFDISHMGEVTVSGARRGGLSQSRADQRHSQTRARPGPIHLDVQRTRRRD